ncbi:MAG: DUF2029 domain-containing protein, partial [Candidatus Eisenbacteria bacterium]|nr:DUF2029 domain-containing protein [Candidatus Eisenbacteria bacterium]
MIQSRSAAWLRGLLIGLALCLVASIVIERVPAAVRDCRGDFANYHVSARLAIEGIDLTPAYRSFAWFQQHLDRAGYAHQIGAFLPFPPETALLALPLAQWSPRPARTAWVALQLGLIALNAWLLSRLARAPWWLGWLLLALSGVALEAELKQGQAYLLVIASLSGGLLLLRRGREVWAGLLFGLLLPIKYAALPFLIVGLAARRWRLTVAAGASAVLVTAIGIALLGWPVHLAFLREVLPRHAAGEIQDPYLSVFQSFPSLLRRMFVLEPSLNPEPWIDAPRLFAGLREGLRVLLLGLLAVPAVQALRGRGALEPTALALAGCWSLVAAPAGATYHSLLLLPPAALLLGHAHAEAVTRRDRVARWLPVAILGLVGLSGLPWALWLRAYDHGASAPLAHGRLWVLLAFTAVALLANRRAVRMAQGGRFGAGWCALAVVAAIGAGLRGKAAAAEPGVTWLGRTESIPQALILDRVLWVEDTLAVRALGDGRY